MWEPLPPKEHGFLFTGDHNKVRQTLNNILNGVLWRAKVLIIIPLLYVKVYITVENKVTGGPVCFY